MVTFTVFSFGHVHSVILTSLILNSLKIVIKSLNAKTFASEKITPENLPADAKMDQVLFAWAHVTGHYNVIVGP